MLCTQFCCLVFRTEFYDNGNDTANNDDDNDDDDDSKQKANITGNFAE